MNGLLNLGVVGVVTAGGLRYRSAFDLIVVHCVFGSVLIISFL